MYVRNEILKKEQLAPSIFRFVLREPVIANHRKPGQFVIVRTSEEGERVPLTIVDSNKSEGSITLIVQAVGSTTQEMSNFEVGQGFHDVAGPLGNPVEIEKFGTVLCIAGGLGIAPLYPIMKALKKRGNKIVTILGARNKDLIILRDEAESISDRMIITTDDGSEGMKGLVTEAAELVITNEKINKAVIIGPPIMMKFSVDVTKKHGVPSIVSLNPIMVDGTGMCGGCRVTVGGETKFACVDGPEFDGDLVDFNELLQRSGMYREKEKEASLKKNHVCRLSNVTGEK